MLKTALSVWIKHAIWRSRKPKVTSDLTTIWTKIPYNGVPIPHPCLLSPKRDISSFWRLLLSWHCHRLAQPERMPIRNTDVHNLWGMDPGVCCSYWWQVPFISLCWCVCISAQSTQICTSPRRWWSSSAQARQSNMPIAHNSVISRYSRAKVLGTRRWD